MILIALLCTLSISFVFLLDNAPVQTGAPYSNIDLQNSLYMSIKVSVLAPRIFNLRKNQSLELPFWTMLLVLLSQRQSLVRVIPSSFVSYTTSKGIPSRVKLGRKSYFLVKLKGITFVFPKLSFMSWNWADLVTSKSLFCKIDLSGGKNKPFLSWYNLGPDWSSSGHRFVSSQTD